ncbi:hypothetical protein, partial [Gluconacetobacter tumulicola]
MAKQVYDAKWRKLSETIRHMTPYCEDCRAEGVITTAEDRDCQEFRVRGVVHVVDQTVARAKRSPKRMANWAF